MRCGAARGSARLALVLRSYFGGGRAAGSRAGTRTALSVRVIPELPEKGPLLAYARAPRLRDST